MLWIPFVVLCLFLLWRFRKPFIISWSMVDNSLRWAKWVCGILAIVALIIGIINPHIPKEKAITRQKDYPLVILFDVSLSMTAKDLAPNRFVVAKQAIIDLVQSLDWFPLSMIVYSRLPVRYIPFSRDTDGIVRQIEQMEMTDFSPTDAFKGTAIGDTLLLATQQLIEYSTGMKNPGGILLLTDGDSNAWIDPRQVMPLLQANGIPLFTLAIGKEDVVIGTVPGWVEVDAPFNISLLESMTEWVDGFFVTIRDASDFSKPFSQLSSFIDQTRTKTVIYPTMAIWYIFFFVSAGFAAIFGWIWWWWMRNRWERIRDQKVWSW